MVGLGLSSNGRLIGGSGRLYSSQSSGDCCCCTNCCFKFCGDERVQGADPYGAGFVIGTLGDAVWEMETNSDNLILDGQGQEGDYDGYCGVEFTFTVYIHDDNTGAQCTGVPGRMYLCSQDHSSDTDLGIPDCSCQCHWHIEIEGCNEDAESCENPTCSFTWNGITWEPTGGCGGAGECSCPLPDEPDPQEGITYTTNCVVNSFPPMNFIGGDGCLDANYDSPVCGRAGTFGTAAMEILDPDLSVQCCCLQSAGYDEGEI